MPYSFEFSPDLDKELKKLKKKDPALFDKVWKKVNQIIEKPEIYKALKYVGGRYKRVHIGSFVMVFEIEEDSIYFLALEHHNKIYKKLK